MLRTPFKPIFKKYFFIFSLFMLPILPALGHPKKEPISLAEAKAWVTQMHQKFHLPGFSVAVIHQGKFVFVDQAGWANLEHRAPVTEKTSFRMGSISKLLTIGLAAKLVENNQLKWQDSINQYVPKTPKKSRAATIAELASHTAGIRHYGANDFNDCERILVGLGNGRLMYPTLEEGLGIFIDDPLSFEPGTAYRYSSYGYNLLGVVLEKVGGANFNQLLADHVYAALDMNHTREDHPYELIPFRANAYNITSDQQWVPAGPSDNSYKWPSGGMVGTPSDLAKLGRAFLNSGWLGEETLQAIFTAQPNAETKQYKVGLGWRISKDEQGRTLYHHGGAIEGGRTHMLLMPETQTVVVLMSNAFARFSLPESLELANFFAK